MNRKGKRPEQRKSTERRYHTNGHSANSYRKESQEKDSPLRSELRDFQEQGIGLYLNGRRYRTDRLCQIVSESNNYMRDYIFEGDDPIGPIEAIDFRELGFEDKKRNYKPKKKRK